MAIAHGSTTTASDNTTSLAITSHVVSGTNPTLIVKVHVRHKTVVPSSVVWDAAGVNESLTKLNTKTVGTARSELWYLPNPTAKTATVTLTFPSAKDVIGAASTYTGVDQTSPFRTAAEATSTGTDDSPTVSIVALNGEMVVDSMTQVSPGPNTAIGDHTERHDVAQGVETSKIRGASQEKASTGATEVMGWTMSGAAIWAICAGPLQEPLPAVPEVSSYMTAIEPPPWEAPAAVGY